MRFTPKNHGIQEESSYTQLSWNETFKAMAKENEDWSEWDNTSTDALEDIP